MKNLLIPLDGSKQSETILPIALLIAAKCDYYQPIPCRFGKRARKRHRRLPRRALRS